MTKLTVIGDIHLDSRIPGYIDSQVTAITYLAERNRPDYVVFLGDIFHSRKPDPYELLACKRIMDEISKFSSIILITGNHDQRTKADDGVTALSLFDSENITVITKAAFGNLGTQQCLFIPYYEDQRVVEGFLEQASETDLVFGHFGYSGCHNSRGDYDWSINPNRFRSTTLLGHIHKHIKRQNIITVGTPYTTSFQEAFKRCVVAQILIGEKGLNIDFEEVNCGPRHIQFDFADLESNKEMLAAPGYFNLVRVFLDPMSEVNQSEVITQIVEEYKVDWVDVKFKSMIDDKLPQSYYETDKQVFTINDEVIEEYVEKSTTKIPKDILMRKLHEIED